MLTCFLYAVIKQVLQLGLKSGSIYKLGVLKRDLVQSRSNLIPMTCDIFEPQNT